MRPPPDCMRFRFQHLRRLCRFQHTGQCAQVEPGTGQATPAGDQKSHEEYEDHEEQGADPLRPFCFDGYLKLTAASNAGSAEIAEQAWRTE